MAQAPAVKPTAPVARASVESVVTTWAAGLTPQNAPDMKHKGPLAWVREVEVGKLIAALAKEGYR